MDPFVIRASAVPVASAELETGSGKKELKYLPQSTTEKVPVPVFTVANAEACRDIL
jgi:hypothetical protein